MAVTTTAINACDVQIYMEDAGGNMVDVSGSSNNVNMDFSNEVGMFKPFGSKWPIRLECGKDASFSVDFVYTTTVSEGYQLLKEWYKGGGKRKFIVDMPDSNPGGDRYEGDFILENFPVAADSTSADPIMVSASLVPTGEVIISTIE